MGSLREIEVLVDHLMRKKFTFRANGVYQVKSAKDCGYTFKWDNAKRRFGCCRYGFRKEISLSKPLCSHNLDKVHGKIKDTILHEIAHALCVDVYGIREGKGHGRNWVEIAVAIGCNGERCYDATKIEQPKSKYTLKCVHESGCGKEYPKHRAPSSSRSYSCNCAPTKGYNAEYKLELIQNY